MLGRAEVERDAVAVKDLGRGEQVEVARADLVAWIQQRLEESPS
jgi:histidyl-tRNA synthetase